MLADRLAREPIQGRSVLDLCTGSGLVAVAAGVGGAAEVVAVDVSRRSLVSVRLNAALNQVRVQPRRGDLFGPVGGRRFDFIASNPPYVPGPSVELPRRGLSRAWEAGPNGRVFLDRICTGAARHLNPGGVLLLVHSTVCGEDQTLEQLRRSGLQAEVVSRHVGSLGPRMRERADWLRQAGLLTGEQEEMIVIRAQAAGLHSGEHRRGAAAAGAR
jgi:release factor glutamine methyltransferase